MKQYLGTKLINAVPMTRQAYNDFRGWKLPEDENGDDAGYLVEYLDGGQANTSTYQGYVSWSPKDVFERAYRLIPTIEGIDRLAPHQQRVVIEKAELDEKIGKLFGFITGEKFDALVPLDERHRLNLQYNVMMAYSKVLELRILAFTAGAA